MICYRFDPASRVSFLHRNRAATPIQLKGRLPTEPFIAEIFFFDTETEFMNTTFEWSGSDNDDVVEETAAPTEVDAQEETPAINGGLDRDIIRRVAKDHANEVDPEPVDQFEFVETTETSSGHTKGVYPLIYIPDMGDEPEPEGDFVVNDDLIVDGSLAAGEATEAFIF